MGFHGNARGNWKRIKLMAFLSLTSDTQLMLHSRFENRELCKLIPDASWDKTQRAWIYPCTPEHLQEIERSFPNIGVGPEVRETIGRIQAKLGKLQEIRQGTAFEFNGLLKTALRSYQRLGASFLAVAERAFLADQMGTGKSLQALAAAILLKQHGKITKCLIVCPNSVKRTTWIRQIEEHTHEQAVLIEGTKKQRITQLQSWNTNAVLFCVVNYEAIRDAAYHPWLQQEMMILDESVKIKNKSAAQTKSIKELPAKYRLCLSGYPIANKPEDLWSQFDWLMPGYLGTWWRFQDHYLTMQPIQIGGRQFKELIGYKNLTHLRQRIEPYVLRRLKSEVLDLPPKIYESREVELTDEQRKLYEAVRQETYVFLSTLDEGTLRLKAREVIVKMLRLSQIVDGFVSDVSWEKPQFFTSPKIDELDGIIEESLASDQAVVVWSRFATMIHRLMEHYQERYGEQVIEISGRIPEKQRSECITRFQQGQATLCLGQIQTGGIGIELHAASTEVFLEKAMISISDILQAEDRLHRLGQDHPVTIISLMAKNTIDEHWERMMKRKQHLAQQIFTFDESMASLGPLKKEELEELLQ